MRTFRSMQHARPGESWNLSSHVRLTALSTRTRAVSNGVTCQPAATTLRRGTLQSGGEVICSHHSLCVRDAPSGASSTGSPLMHLRTACGRPRTRSLLLLLSALSGLAWPSQGSRTGACSVRSPVVMNVRPPSVTEVWDAMSEAMCASIGMVCSGASLWVPPHLMCVLWPVQAPIAAALPIRLGTIETEVRRHSLRSL